MLQFEGDILLEYVLGENFFVKLKEPNSGSREDLCSNPLTAFPISQKYTIGGSPQVFRDKLVLNLHSRCLSFTCLGNGTSHQVILCCNKHTQKLSRDQRNL